MKMINLSVHNFSKGRDTMPPNALMNPSISHHQLVSASSQAV